MKPTKKKKDFTLYTKTPPHYEALPPPDVYVRDGKKPKAGEEGPAGRAKCLEKARLTKKPSVFSFHDLLQMPSAAQLKTADVLALTKQTGGPGYLTFIDGKAQVLRSALMGTSAFSSLSWIRMQAPERQDQPTALDVFAKVMSLGHSGIWFVYAMSGFFGDLLVSTTMLEWASQVGARLTLFVESSELSSAIAVVNLANTVFQEMNARNGVVDAKSSRIHVRGVVHGGLAKQHSKELVVLTRDGLTILHMTGSANPSYSGFGTGNNETLHDETFSVSAIPVCSNRAKTLEKELDSMLDSFWKNLRMITFADFEDRWRPTSPPARISTEKLLDIADKKTKITILQVFPAKYPKYETDADGNLIHAAKKSQSAAGKKGGSKAGAAAQLALAKQLMSEDGWTAVNIRINMSGSRGPKIPSIGFTFPLLALDTEKGVKNAGQNVLYFGADVSSSPLSPFPHGKSVKEVAAKLIDTDPSDIHDTSFKDASYASPYAPGAIKLRDLGTQRPYLLFELKGGSWSYMHYLDPDFLVNAPGSTGTATSSQDLSVASSSSSVTRNTNEKSKPKGKNASKTKTEPSCIFRKDSIKYFNRLIVRARELLSAAATPSTNEEANEMTDAPDAAEDTALAAEDETGHELGDAEMNEEA